MNAHPLIAAVREAGIVGQGGAGFPMHVKLDASVDTVIANGCECEPLLATDQYIMRHETGRLLDGLHAVMEATNAKNGVIAVKHKHASLVRQLREAVAGTAVSLLLMDNFYPAGDEQVLIFEATGRSVPPLALPKSVGCVVSNVGSLVSAANALKGLPVTDRVVTVSGDVRRPSVFTVPIGTAVRECIEHAGGSAVSDAIVILGGPMMGAVLDTPETVAAAVVTKTLGGILVLPQGHYLHRTARQNVATMRRRAATACIQCRFCSDLCPRYLIGHPFETHRIMRAFGAGTEMEGDMGELAQLCCGCGVCEHVACPMNLSPCTINTAIKSELAKAKKRYGGDTGIREDHTLWRNARRTPIPRLAARIGISSYLDIHPEEIEGFIPQTVDIPLSQHIGAPCVPVCKAGDFVNKGALLAAVPEKALGAPIHASVDGVVESIGSSIRIRRS